MGPLRSYRRRPLCKDGSQRCRVRDDAGIRRGLRPLRRLRVRARQREDRASVDAGLGCPLVAVRARSASVRARRQRPGEPRALRRGLGRGPLDDRGRDRQAHPDAGHHHVALRAIQLARAERVRREGERGAAQPVRRPRSEEQGAGARGRLMAITTTTTPEQQENPLTEGLERLPVHPTTLVIFGASGDLAKRKLLPAIYNLAHEGALPERFNLIGCARSEWSDEEFREVAKDAIQMFSRRTPDETVLESLLSRVRYVAGSFDDENLFTQIGELAATEDEEAGIVFNRIFYLAVAPTFFETIAEQLGKTGMNRRGEGGGRMGRGEP